MTAKATAIRPLEVWVGPECTVNRVGDEYFDQIERSGHAVRIKDLERLSGLGVTTFRYPILWERMAASGIDSIDWSWADERLNRLRDLNVTPIVGLVHHGSGPRYTSLIDPHFPEKLAEFASRVARRYPWIKTYTPINEPLTTARFSGLYGRWYPHGRDARTFAQCFLLQCRGVVLSMRAIRGGNPEAELLQTEDLGKTFSTPTLSYQAEFENERRWLTFDLLTGRVLPGHPMFEYLTWLGINPEELQWFNDNPCPPKILGINHYITSERFLDERLTRYPTHTHGGNEKHAYADVEAVRVCAEGVAGPKALIKETWRRYGLPIAITEAHLACTREEQLRWFKTVWEAAKESCQEGIDVRAVTAWSAFGAFNWNNTLTVDNGHYEPGVFDLRAPEPRPTALAQFIRTLSQGSEYQHGVLDTPGWWERFDRLCYPPVSRRLHDVVTSVCPPHKLETSSTRPLLITGASGTLGRAFARICERRGLAYYLLTRNDLDIANPVSVEAALECFEPWGLINAAGYVRVDDAELDRDTCLRENALGPDVLARSCKAGRISLLTYSSNLVFSGKIRRPYVESDSTAPLNVYGASKVRAERGVLADCPDALVIRTSAFFGPWDNHNFANQVLKALSEGKTFRAASDETISPTYVPDLVNASLDLLIDGERGIWHVTNDGALTWADFARLLANHAGYDCAHVQGVSGRLLGLRARRPTYSALKSERGNLMSTLEDAVERYLNETLLWRRCESGAPSSQHSVTIMKTKVGAEARG